GLLVLEGLDPRAHRLPPRRGLALPRPRQTALLGQRLGPDHGLGQDRGGSGPLRADLIEPRWTLHRRGGSSLGRPWGPPGPQGAIPEAGRIRRRAVPIAGGVGGGAITVAHVVGRGAVPKAGVVRPRRWGGAVAEARGVRRPGRGGAVAEAGV